jgi:hypothetical protein
MRTLVFLLSGSLFATFAQTPCDGLKSISLPGATITALESLAGGRMWLRPAGAALLRRRLRLPRLRADGRVLREQGAERRRLRRR